MYNLLGECLGVVETLLSLFNRGESDLGGSLATFRLEGGL